MKISVIVLLASCAIISNICYTQAAYARSEAEQLKAELQSFYDAVALSAKMKNQLLERASAQEQTRAKCYSQQGCSWLIGWKQNAAVCCTEGTASGRSFEFEGSTFCHNCSN